VIGSRRTDLLHCSVAYRGDVLVARWRGRARRCYPIHSDRDPADQQAIAEPDAGQAVSRGGSATRSLGRVARGEKRPQCSGALAIAVSSYFREVLMNNADGLSTAQGKLRRVFRK
jgi:hypothetical protein